MKKLLIFFSLLFSFNVSYGAPIQIGTLTQDPYYTILENDDIQIITGSGGSSTSVYDKNGVLIQNISGSLDLITGLGNFKDIQKQYIFETENAIYFYFHVYEAGYGGLYMDQLFKYNKITGNYSPSYRVYASGAHISCAVYNAQYTNNCNINDTRIAMDGDFLVLAPNSTGQKSYIDITDETDTITVIDYAGNISYPNMEPITDNYFYRLSLNNINYIDENLKTYNFVLTDAVGDIIRVNDVFVTTYDLGGWSYLYDPITTKSNLSLFGSNGEDLRYYFDYELETANFIDGEFFIHSYDGELVKIGTPTTLGLPYSRGIHQLNVWLLDSGGTPTFYYIDDLNVIYKDGDIDTSGILVPFPGGDNGGGGGGYGEITDEQVTGVFDIVDLNGDGEISYIEWLQNIASMPGRIWDLLTDFIGIFKEIIDSIFNMELEEKSFSFSFFETVNASIYTEMIDGRLDDEITNETIYGQLYNFLKYGFIGLVLFSILFIFLIYGKND